MTYKIIFTDKSLRQLKKLEKDERDRIIRALERIRIRPEVHVTKLVEDPGYRLRVDAHRVILDIEKRKLLILILKVGHRKNIYK
ncbi:cytotoxic translational repressor of toxin-antitoxin stability system [Thermoplasmatales archaeon SCGC AB-540-F20]|nr:cytotoxic translational repressor of toxin-antitoxin stability system [Thermoplasmatales archaeon SCGC AB-540-F20]